MLSNEIKERLQQTCLEKYEQQKFTIIKKKYNDTILHYQGTYEKNFLDIYYNNFYIENGPSIKYKYNDEYKSYFSDFYIKSKKLTVEIKSEYYYNLHLDKNLAKQKACIEQGYNFIFIINKNYDNFNKLF